MRQTLGRTKRGKGGEEPAARVKRREKAWLEESGVRN